jgi:diacylglycerol kinase
MKKRSFIKGLGCAFRGIYVTYKTERNFKFHTLALLVAIAVGISLGLSVVEWCLVVFAIGFVLVAELLNTALERWCDEAAGGKQSEIIRNAKDISSAAVLVSAITAIVIGILVLLIPLIQRIF